MPANPRSNAYSYRTAPRVTATADFVAYSHTHEGGGGLVGESHRTNGPGRDPESSHNHVPAVSVEPVPNMPIWRSRGTMQHVIAGATSGTIPGWWECVQLLVASRTSSRLVLPTSASKTRKQMGTRRLGCGSGSRLGRFLAPHPCLTRTLAGCLYASACSRGVKNSECLGVASSDDKRAVLTRLNWTDHPPSCAMPLSPRVPTQAPAVRRLPRCSDPAGRGPRPSDRDSEP